MALNNSDIANNSAFLHDFDSQS